MSIDAFDLDFWMAAYCAALGAIIGDGSMPSSWYAERAAKIADEAVKAREKRL